MTRTVLLERLRDLTEDVTKDIIMPVAMQKGDMKQQHRAAEVHLMRLPDSTAAKKKAPYIIHQVITGIDIQPSGVDVTARATVRSVFSVYSYNESEGALMLLNLMERLRIALLKQVLVGEQFELDLTEGLEMLIYPDDTAPYFAGEMKSVWKLPAVEREVNLYGENQIYPRRNMEYTGHGRGH